MGSVVMKKLKSAAAVFTALIFFNFSTAQAFRDVDSQSERAIQELDEAGMFDSFLFKHGTTHFRPEANVSRGDLLLVLQEYYMVASRLFDQNRQILAKLEELERRGLSSSDMDAVMRELQRNLDPMIRHSSAIRELRNELADLPTAETPPSPEPSREYDEDIEELRKELAGLREDMQRLPDERRVEPARPSPAPDSLILPFWARVSLGFSALTLLFMAR